MKEFNTAKSKELFMQSKKFLVDGVASSLHKSEFEEYPIFIDHAKGSKLYDVDGNEYIDHMGAFGPMILGYCPNLISEAVVEQIQKGSQFAAPTESLNELSEKLTKIIPCGEMVSYQGSGTEAVITAFRLARAYTGKNKIVKFEGHYHGWTDEQLVSVFTSSIEAMGPRENPEKVMGSIGQRRATTDDLIVLPWNDLKIVERLLKRHGHEIAGIITEPTMCNCEPIKPVTGYLEGLKQLSKKYEVVLIFDEVITGFRLALGGGQEYFDVTPDISTFAKAIAAGYPLAGVAGRKDIMEAGVHPAGTFNANPISVSACLATIKVLENRNTYKHLEKITSKIVNGVKRISETLGVKLFCDHTGSIWQIQFGITEPMKEYRDNFKVDKQKYQKFYSKCLRRGIRLHPSRGRFYTSTAHTEDDVQKTLHIFEEVLRKLEKFED